MPRGAAPVASAAHRRIDKPVGKFAETRTHERDSFGTEMRLTGRRGCQGLFLGVETAQVTTRLGRPESCAFDCECACMQDAKIA
eukprot:6210461-Pleurochrysis_carterae.AAC.1